MAGLPVIAAVVGGGLKFVHSALSSVDTTLRAGSPGHAYLPLQGVRRPRTRLDDDSRC